MLSSSAWLVSLEIRFRRLTNTVDEVSVRLPGEPWASVSKTLAPPAMSTDVIVGGRKLTAYYLPSTAAGPIVGKDMVWLVDADGLIVGSIWCRSGDDIPLCRRILGQL
jgi:hypothetical protein